MHEEVFEESFGEALAFVPHLLPLTEPSLKWDLQVGNRRFNITLQTALQTIPSQQLGV